MRYASFRALVAAALLSAAPVTALGQELRTASASPPAAASYNPLYTVFMEKLRELSDGEMTARHIGAETVGVREVPNAIASGLIDVGNVLAVSFPADFPNMMLLNELGPFGEDAFVVAGAMIEYMTSCKECAREMASKGIVYVNNVSSWPVYLATGSRPVASPADLRGMRIRSGGGYHTSWLEHMGAIPVEVQYGEIYEALQTGLVDGAIASEESFYALRAFETVRNLSRLPIGTYHAVISYAVRQQTWAGLSEAQKETLIRATLYGVHEYIGAARRIGDELAGELRARNGNIVEPDDAFVAAHEDFRAQMREAAIELARTRYGIAEPEASVNRFVELLDRWSGLLDGAQDDAEAFVDLVWNEVWAKVDLSTYGQ